MSVRPSVRRAVAPSVGPLRLFKNAFPAHLMASIGSCFTFPSPEYSDDDRCGRILHLIVENLVYPVTLKTLALIFKKYGHVDKILTFTKNNLFQVSLPCLKPSSALGEDHHILKSNFSSHPPFHRPSSSMNVREMQRKRATPCTDRMSTTDAAICRFSERS